VAAWRAVWAALPNNPVMAARFAHLTTREHNRLARQQARTACAAALLRWIHVVITRRIAWDPPSPGGPHCGKPHKRHPTTGHYHQRPAAVVKDPGGASPNVPRGTHLAQKHGQPRPSPHRARFTLSGTTRLKARQSTRRRRSTRPA
jgi:hypothetical protein